VADLQHAVRTADESPEGAQARYDQFAKAVNGSDDSFLTIRSLFGVKRPSEEASISRKSSRRPISSSGS
jgi:hypothetical protein